MLVLSRKPNEKLLFPGIQAAVQVVAIKPGVVRLGVEAPPDVAVLRAELLAREAGGPARGDPAAGAANEAREREHRLRNRLNAAAVGLALLRKQQELGLARDSGATLDRLAQEIEGMRSQLGGPAPPPRSAPPRRRALLVEDDANERELLAGFLRLAGLEVDTAEDGADALERLRAGGRPDVVLLDMGLPRCDGPSTVREIRREPAWARLKVIAVTGHPPERFPADSGAAGVDRWFRKPVKPDEFLLELDRELAGTA
jgi:carbon storage regulator CsrA